VPVLALEPWLFRGRGPSLLRELSAGDPRRILRLLAAGLGCGLFWEAANFFATGKWIYTVPWFEHLKVFEMPPLGFVGFAPFALCCWCLARALCRLGLLPEWEVGAETRAAEAPDADTPDAEAPETDTAEPDAAVTDAAESDAATPAETIDLPPRLLRTLRMRAVVIAAAAVFSLLVLAAMDRWTVDSRRPHPEDVPGIPDGIAEYAHQHGRHDIRGVLEMIEDGAFYVPGESSAAALEALEGRCRLVLLRGIGTANAARLGRVGVGSPEDLAARERDELTTALAALDEPGWRPRPRRVGVWIAAARKAVAAD
jgi:hypothetical protein